MKTRTVVMTFEVETDLPVKVLRQATLRVFRTNPPAGQGCFKNVAPVNCAKVEVVNATKGRKK